MIKRTYKILRFNTVIDTVTLTSTTAIDHEIALSEYKRNILPSNCWMEELRDTFVSANTIHAENVAHARNLLNDI